MSGRGDERAFKGCTAAVVAAVRIPMARVVAVVDGVGVVEDSDEGEESGGGRVGGRWRGRMEGRGRAGAE